MRFETKTASESRTRANCDGVVASVLRWANCTVNRIGVFPGSYPGLCKKYSPPDPVW